MLMFLPDSHWWTIFVRFSSLVRSTRQCAAAIGSNLVRRIAGISAQINGWPIDAGGPIRLDVSHLQHDLYDCAKFRNGKVHEKTICEIYLPFDELRILFEYVKPQFVINSI